VLFGELLTGAAQLYVPLSMYVRCETGTLLPWALPSSVWYVMSWNGVFWRMQ
jgi:hypothetical protein